MSDISISAQIKDAIRLWSDNRPRSLQKGRGVLGISDVGGCREYARRIVVGTPPSNTRETWAADVGTAVDWLAKQAIEYKFGHAETDHKVICTYPNGAELPGTPDIVIPQVVLDIKTKDGLASIRKAGPTNQNWYQVMGYAKGLIDDGTFTSRGNITCALVFLDRSGKDSEPAVFEKLYDPLILNEAAEWIDDVTYAVEHGEEAAKDWPINKCEQYCEFFYDCRGRDISPEGGLIDHPETISWVAQYVEGKDMEKAGKQLKDEARTELEGVDGSTGQFTVRWTKVNESEIPGYTRNGYTKLDIRPVKKGG